MRIFPMHPLLASFADFGYCFRRALRALVGPTRALAPPVSMSGVLLIRSAT